VAGIQGPWLFLKAQSPSMKTEARKNFCRRHARGTTEKCGLPQESRFDVKQFFREPGQNPGVGGKNKGLLWSEQPFFVSAF
jgi:hypothetical protein